MANPQPTPPDKLANRPQLDALADRLASLEAAELELVFDHIGKESPAYLDIMAFQGDVLTDRDFQRTFNGFYRLRQRPEQWYRDFYEVFSAFRAVDVRQSPVDFGRVLSDLHDRTNRWEYSFATKLLHTISPDMAIMDSRVLDLIDLPQPAGKHRELAAFIAHYADLRGALAYLIEKLPEILQSFDDRLPQLRALTPTKKMDFILWRLPV